MQIFSDYCIVGLQRDIKSCMIEFSINVRIWETAHLPLPLTQQQPTDNNSGLILG